MTAPAGGGSGTGWYVYGVVAAADARDGLLEDQAGIDGAAVELIRDESLAAIATEVPLSDFADDVIGERLRDLDWLESHVRLHETVLEAALAAPAVVPFRFGAIYVSSDHVRQMLSGHPGLRSALDRVRGRVELGVKGFLGASPEENEAGAELSAGHAYMAAKQRARQVAEQRERLRAELAYTVHEQLTQLAAEAVANPLQRPELSGRDDEMFLNGAYLVERAREEEFRAAAAGLETDLAEHGGVLEVTGPWPPYNFVEEQA